MAGSGPPVLFVMGLGYDRFGWGPVLDLVAQQFTVIAVDNRGIGESDVPRGPYSVGQLAADAVAVLDAEGVAKAHVVGVSLGGMIAQELALSYPGRVDRLVLGCTTPGGDTYPVPAPTIELFMRFPTLPLEEGLLLMVRNSLSAASAEGRPDLVDEVYRYRLGHQPPVDGWQAQFGAALSFRAGDRLAGIEAPTLVVTGDADNVIDHRNSQLLVEAIPGARFEPLPGSGHLFFWEEPARFAALLADFLA